MHDNDTTTAGPAPHSDTERSALVRAANAVIQSTIRGGRPLSQRQIDVLRHTPITTVQKLPDPDRQFVLAGQIMVFSRVGMVVEAHELVEGALENGGPAGPSSPPFAAFIALSAAAVEVYLSAGDSVRALEHAQRVSRYAREGELSPAWQHRAWGLLAASQALNGEFRAAEESLEQGEALIAEQGWNAESIDYMSALAEGLIAHTTLDGERAARVSRRLEHVAKHDASSQSLLEVLDALSHSLNGNPHRATVLATRVAHGTSQPEGPPLLRVFAELLNAVFLLLGREPMRALGQIQDIEAPEGHMICPSSVRAVAYIHMGNFTSALVETSGCVKRRVKHNQWYLPLVLLGRAVAHLRIGNKAIAVRKAAEAFSHVSDGKYLAGAFSLFPAEAITELLDLVHEQAPQQIEDLAPFRTALMASAQEHQETLELPQLSTRETAVALQMRYGKSFAAIAEELFVATGTVRSQASSIYQKLGVETREGAVRYLEEIGFYEL